MWKQEINCLCNHCNRNMCFQLCMGLSNAYLFSVGQLCREHCWIRWHLEKSIKMVLLLSCCVFYHFNSNFIIYMDYILDMCKGI